MGSAFRASGREGLEPIEKIAVSSTGYLRAPGTVEKVVTSSRGYPRPSEAVSEVALSAREREAMEIELIEKRLSQV